MYPVKKNVVRAREPPTALKKKIMLRNSEDHLKNHAHLMDVEEVKKVEESIKNLK
jgi:hypothetical protein